MQKRCSGVSHHRLVPAYVVQRSGEQMKGSGSPPWVYLPLQGTQTAPISAKHYLHHAVHPVCCGPPPRARTGTPRGQAALKLREGSKNAPKSKDITQGSEPCCKHLLKMMMLGFIGKKWDVSVVRLTRSLYHTHWECTLLLGGAAALPGQLPSRAPSTETSSFISHSSPSTQHLQDRYPGPFILSTHHA